MQKRLLFYLQGVRMSTNGKASVWRSGPRGVAHKGRRLKYNEVSVWRERAIRKGRGNNDAARSTPLKRKAEKALPAALLALLAVAAFWIGASIHRRHGSPAPLPRG